MFVKNETVEIRRRELANALANMSNVLYALQHKQDTWDNRIMAMQQMAKLIPLIIRYYIYFKNLEKRDV